MGRAEVELLFALLVDRHEGDIPGAGRPGLGQGAGVGISHPLHHHPELVPQRRAEIGTGALGPCRSGRDRHVAGARRQTGRDADAQLAGRCQLREDGRIDRLRLRDRGGCKGDDERERPGETRQPPPTPIQSHRGIMTCTDRAG
jgi:hypothetical protein